MPPLTTEQKIGELFFIGIPGPEIDARTELLIREIGPGGICLFARNIRSPRQTRDLIDSIGSLFSAKRFFGIDQEGGLVDRLRRIMTPMPAANKFEAAPDVIEFARIVAEALRMLGFNMNFAPVVDLIDEKRENPSNGLYSRAFGQSLPKMIELSGAFLDEMQRGGIVGCLKHFPGLGAAAIDSHEDLPFVDIGEAEFEGIDLAPYREFIEAKKAEMIMVAHAAYPKLGLQQRTENGRLIPSSLSTRFVTDLLREGLGFDGVAITDDLEMGAIEKNFGIGEACKMAINAGNDMLAICASEDAIRTGFDAVCGAVRNGEIDETRIDISLKRTNTLRSKLSPSSQFDQRRLDELSLMTASLCERLNR